jgi:hypothetical protein
MISVDLDLKIPESIALHVSVHVRQSGPRDRPSQPPAYNMFRSYQEIACGVRCSARSPGWKQVQEKGSHVVHMSALLTGSGGRGCEISLTWMAMASHLICGQMRPWSRDCTSITLVQSQTTGQTSAASQRAPGEAKKSPVRLVYPFQGLCAWGAGLEELVGTAANVATRFPAP